VADVSHELRNPLAALRAQLEVAVEHPGPSTVNLLAGSIMEVNRLSQLVQDLLTLARLDDGMFSLHPGDVDLDDLALIHAARLRAQGKVDVSVGGVSAARMRGDEAQLTRAVANLADNAERHARQRVAFAVTRENDSLLLSVADDGPGVPIAERTRIFERFVRLDSARPGHRPGDRRGARGRCLGRGCFAGRALRHQVADRRRHRSGGRADRRAAGRSARQFSGFAVHLDDVAIRVEEFHADAPVDAGPDDRNLRILQISVPRPDGAGLAPPKDLERGGRGATARSVPSSSPLKTVPSLQERSTGPKLSRRR
jgi:hypothetical protein